MQFSKQCRGFLVSGVVLSVAATGTAAEDVDFVRDVQAIFEQHCYDCHGADTPESGLRLDVGSAALAGGDSGPAIVPGKPGESLLITYVTAEDPEERMPPDSDPLPAEQIETLRKWIEQGAEWPQSADAASAGESDHWAYQPLAPGPTPQFSDSNWPRNEIDSFVLARLQEAGLSPSPEADRYTQIRRLYYDLIGLPPTPEEADRFANDPAPDAYERLVDRILANPHFGERWGRHWLDKARYADSDGYEKDRPRFNAWFYRDWVIDAINADQPFDQFTLEQLAGDLLSSPTPDQLLATAFNRQTLTNTEGGTDQEQWRVEAVFDRTETLGSVWLGLTVGCARCHSHKYDQLTQREYYELFAFFNNADETTKPRVTDEEMMAEYVESKRKHDAKMQEQQAELNAIKERLQPALEQWLAASRQVVTEAAARETAAAKETDPPAEPQPDFPDAIVKLLKVSPEKLNDKQRGELFEHFGGKDQEYTAARDALDKLKKQAPFKPEATVPVLAERSVDPRTTHVFKRGDFLQPLGEVDPDTIEVLHELPTDGSRTRLDLAQWLTSADNPLTPRVVANQLWLQLFGEGIVRTPNDFGVRGERPTHPQLLDWLAAELIRNGWSRKALIRTIVCSATYRQSAAVRDVHAQRDPENRLWSRQGRRRVEAEIVRDLYLAAAGLLDRRVGGPSVFPPLPDGIAELSYANNFRWGNSDWNNRPDRPANVAPKEDIYRRGMYTFFKRTAAHPNLVTFDCPDANTTCIRRRASNTPLQALQTLNNAVFVAATRSLAQRAISDRSDDVDRIRFLIRTSLSRPASEDDVAILRQLLADARQYYADHPQKARQLAGDAAKSEQQVQELATWTAVARVVLNTDEFLTRN